MQDNVELQELQLSGIMNAIRPLIDSKLKRANISLIEEYNDISIMTDMSEISQVIMNLINNGIDAIKENKGTLEYDAHNPNTCFVLKVKKR